MSADDSLLVPRSFVVKFLLAYALGALILSCSLAPNQSTNHATNQNREHIKFLESRFVQSSIAISHPAEKASYAINLCFRIGESIAAMVIHRSHTFLNASSFVIVLTGF